MDQVVVEQAEAPVVAEEEPKEDLCDGAAPENAHLVFDSTVAEAWLRKAHMRQQNIYRSVRFEPEGMPEKHIDWLLHMAAQAVLKKYLTYKNSESYCHGILFVPVSLANHQELQLMQRVKGRFGKYAAFRWQ